MPTTTPFLGLALLSSSDQILPDITAMSANFTTIDTNAQAHQQGTTNVHGIADTSQLVTQSQLSALVSTGALMASNNLSDLQSVSTARTNLGLGSAAVQNTSYFDLAGAAAAEQSRAEGVEATLAPLTSPVFTGTPLAPTAAPGTNTTQIATTAFVAAALSGTSAAGALLAANNLSDLANAATARTNLGLGAAATANFGTTAGTAAQGNDSRITGALQTTGGTMSGSIAMGGKQITGMQALGSSYGPLQAAPVGAITQISETANLTDPKFGGVVGTTTDWGPIAAAIFASSTTGGRLFIPPGSWTFPNGGMTGAKGSWKVKGAGLDASVIDWSGTPAAAGTTGGAPNGSGGIVSKAYGGFGGDFRLSIDELTITGGTLVPGWAYSSAQFTTTTNTNDTLAVTIPPECSSVGWTVSNLFGTWNGSAVSGSNPGYVWVADQLVQYTGVSGSTLTGCNIQQVAANWNFTLAPAQCQPHARVYPLNQGGHGIAFQGQQLYVGQNVRVNGTGIGGHAIFVNGDGTGTPGGGTGASSPSPFGHNIKPGRLDSIGGFDVAFGPTVTDGRAGGWSSNRAAGYTDRYGSILTMGGDISLLDWHFVGPAGLDLPMVHACAGQLTIELPVADTTTAPAVQLDSTGHWAQPNNLKDVQLKSYKWVDSGQVAPQPGNAPSQGTPLIQSLASTATTGLRTQVRGITSDFGYSHIIEEGARSPIVNGGSALTLPASTLNLMQSYGFDPFGGTATLAGQSLTYTGLTRAVGLVASTSATGAKNMPANGVAGTVTLSGVRGTIPSSGIAVAWVAGGPLQIPYTSVSGNVLSLTATAANGGKNIYNAWITFNQLTGVSGGTGTAADLSVASMFTSGSWADQAEVSGQISISNVVSLTNMNAASTQPKTGPGPFSPFVFKDRAGTATVGAGEWSFCSPSGANQTLNLPLNPSVGQVQRFTLQNSNGGTRITTIYTTDGNPIWLDGVSTPGVTGVQLTKQGMTMEICWIPYGNENAWVALILRSP